MRDLKAVVGVVAFSISLLSQCMALFSPQTAILSTQQTSSTTDTPGLYKSSFVLTVPSYVRPSMTFNIGVNLPKAEGACTLTAVIKAGEEIVASAVETFTKEHSALLSLQLPDALPEIMLYVLDVRSNGSLNFHATQYLKYRRKSLSFFIQTDRPIYTPGNEVQFRAFAIFPTFRMFKEGLSIAVYDSKFNKVYQWVNHTALNGLVAHAFSLPSKPQFGSWTIELAAMGQSFKKSFIVKEDVRPLFDVSVVMPSYALCSQDNLFFAIQARHRTGKPVVGEVHVSLKLLPPGTTVSQIANISSFLDLELPFRGDAAPLKIPIRKIQQASSSYLDSHKVFVLAKVTESLTGKAYVSNGTVQFFSFGEMIEFPVSLNKKRFKPGMELMTFVKVSQPDGLPIPNVKGNIVIRTKMIIVDSDIYSIDPNRPALKLSTQYLPEFTMLIPVNGLVSFPIMIHKNAIFVQIYAQYEEMRATLFFSASFSPSYSFIQVISAESKEFKVGDTMKFIVNSTQPLQHFTYQIMARGELVQTENVYGGDSTSATFFIKATMDMAPNARIVVYYVKSDGEIVADSFHFQIRAVFRNEVDIVIDQTVGEPDDQMCLSIVADGGSHMYFSAVDQRLHYKNSISEITLQQVYDELDDYDLIWQQEYGSSSLTYSWHHATYGGKDTHQIFKNSGLVILTDALVYQYNSPFHIQTAPTPATENHDLSHSVFISTNDVDYLGRIQTYSLSSWLWADLPTCTNGEATLFTRIPQALTSWIIYGFSIDGHTGFGIPSGPSLLSVYRPFFMVVDFPSFAIILGEEVALGIIIFNYMAMDQNVQVTLPKTFSFTNVYRDCNGAEYQIHQEQVVFVMVKAGQTASVFFPIIPLFVGVFDIYARIQSSWAADGAKQQIRVVAPGLTIDYNIPVFIDLTGKYRSFQKHFDINLPANIVKGSEHVIVSLSGDLMGSSIKGLDALLRAPTGCGEQTMISLAPDVSIVEYLHVTNQLAGQIKDKALHYMQMGYMQELNFIHPDGSFSAFGTRDVSGSMWLSAFVVRVFHQASFYIYIDQDILIKAIQWMIGLQNDDGSFPEPGRVIHKNMQGQSGGGPSLTAFVFLALLENGDLFENSTEFDVARQKSLTFLEAEVERSSDVYFLAMASYALQLADSNHTEGVLDKLQTKAVSKDNIIHWHMPHTEKSTVGLWHRPNPSWAVDVEVTSYVLSTYSIRHELFFSRKIFDWVIQQRNAKGGFSSTQDTVIALNALSLYAELVFFDHISIKSEVSLDQGEKFTFYINKHNVLTSQRRETRTIPSSLKVEASGKGLAMVEISVNFNVESNIEETSFDLNITLHNQTTNYFCMESCASWQGDGPVSGMAVQEIGIPSGFDPDLDPLTELDVVRMFEIKDNNLVLYFDEISRDPLCLMIKFDRTGLVGKNKPSAIKLYDYYEPRNQLTYFYHSTILEKLSICDVCTTCHNCEEVVSGSGATGGHTFSLEDEEASIAAQMSQK